MEQKKYYALVNNTNSFGRYGIIEHVSTKQFKDIRDFVCYEITKEEYETIMNNDGDDIRFEFKNNVGKRLIY